jgi:UDP-2,4-diacetamido-2,4,6-trideoxy-beta-L-altropyranose hydrolase
VLSRRTRNCLKAIAQKLATLSQTVNLGWHQNIKSQNIAEKLSTLLQSAEQRRNMSKLSQKIVDGKGADSVVCNLAANSIKLRPVKEEDCELLWQWASESVIID